MKFVLPVVVLLTGCTGPQAFTTLHVLDTAQTIRGPALMETCHEADPITSRIIGEKPSVGEVLLWSGAVYLGYRFLREHIDPKYRPTLDWTLVAVKAYQVGKNATIADCN